MTRRSLRRANDGSRFFIPEPVRSGTRFEGWLGLVPRASNSGGAFELASPVLESEVAAVGVFHPRAALQRLRPGFGGMGVDPEQLARDGVGVAAWDEPGEAWEGHGHATHLGGDHRGAGGETFESGEGETLLEGGLNDGIGAAEEVGQFAHGMLGGPADDPAFAVGKSELAG